MSALSMSIEPDLQWLAAVRMVLRRTLPDLPDDQASLFHGAVTEILVNAIQSHARIGSDEPVTIRLDLGDAPTITIVDAGPGFDPEVIDITPDRTSRGLAIARTVCPDLRIDSSSAGTVVVLPFPLTDH